MKKLIIWTVLALSLFFLFVFLAHSKIFYKLAKEDSYVETFSAALYFLNCGLFICIFFILHHRLSSKKAFYLIISFSFAFLFFLIGMEEVSWFQRVLHFKTPELFKGNLRGEMNLHNFSTNLIENIYYFSSFVFLILIPFIDDKTILFEKNNVLSFFIPSRFVLFVSAIFVAYNYDMWNILFSQLSFFVTLFILIHYAWSYKNIHNNNFVLSFFVIIMAVLTQALFLIYGKNFVRISDVTEYKEMFIPLFYFMYSFEVFHRAKRIRYNQVGNKVELVQ